MNSFCCAIADCCKNAYNYIKGEEQNQLNVGNNENYFNYENNSNIIIVEEKEPMVVLYDLSELDTINDKKLLNDIFEKRNSSRYNDCNYCVVVTINGIPVNYVFLKPECAEAIANEENVGATEMFNFKLENKIENCYLITKITEEEQNKEQRYSVFAYENILTGMNNKNVGEIVYVPDLRYDDFLKVINEKVNEKKLKQLNNQEINNSQELKNIYNKTPHT